jgi:DNA-binding transcriptional LysR family regulator
VLDLRRLRLLHELHVRGTIAAVADALRYTPSAVSQQLAVLERETGVALLEPAGRGVRLTDAALVLVGHARALLEQVDLAEAELAAAADKVVGRARIASFQSVALQIAMPAMRALAEEAPELRCELVEAEPEQALPALALGDVDLVLGDEWEHQPLARSPAITREDLCRDPIRIVLPDHHPSARRHRRAVPLAEIAGDAWTAGHQGSPWDEIIRRTCRELGGFEPDIRHRTNDSVLSLALIAAGQAVTLLPQLVRPDAHPGIAVRDVADGSPARTIFAATRTSDAPRPSVHALLRATRAAAAQLTHPAQRRAGEETKTLLPANE